MSKRQSDLDLDTILCSHVTLRKVLPQSWILKCLFVYKMAYVTSPSDDVYVFNVEVNLQLHLCSRCLKE